MEGEVSSRLDRERMGKRARAHRRGQEALEFKFVVVRHDGSLSWESGHNRVLRLPESGRAFSVVCHWDATGEALDVVVVPQEEEEVEVRKSNVGWGVARERGFLYEF
ncbi:Carbohydrate binding module family 20 protein [Raphanus sativus]|nr:Carbohydrate binding module family 20 protein [Raphanus sativus]